MNILDHEIILGLFRSNYLFFVGCVFCGAFILTWYLIPKVLWVSKEKQLTKNINERSSHSLATPSFGGVAFFMCLVVIISLLQSIRLTFTGNHLIIAATVLFLVGLKDDLVVSTARVKLFGQITAACFILFSPELQLKTLYGFWGIYEIPVELGYILKAVIIIALINAYNLIDGIDGLAAIIGMVICSTYAVAFYSTGHPYFVLISISLVGMLGAFLRFNFSRGRRKIFMGDSGSLIVGLMIAFLTLKVLVMEPYPPMIKAGFTPENRLLFAIATLFIPVFDTLRVIIIRMVNAKSPFSADRNHAHHVLLDLGCSHVQASLWLGGLNIIIISFYLVVSRMLDSVWMSLCLIIMFAGMALLFKTLKLKAERRLISLEASL